MRKGIARLELASPFNFSLDSVRSRNGGNGVASRPVEDILMPGGVPIGAKASGRRATARMRELPGGLPAAEQLFKDLTQGGRDITPPTYAGTLIELPGGRGVVGLRPVSRSGPPTIDVNAIDSTGKPIPIERIKFVD
jgi:hypothetical protein